MKPFSSLLTIGALLAFAGSVVAAPVPDAAAAPVPAKETRIVWHTVTHVKVVGVTKTHWVDPPTSTPTTKTTETSSTTEEETTTTTTTTSSTTTSSTTTSTTESTTEEEESTTSTTTTSTTSSTTSSTTTEEETSTTETPTPTPPKPTIPEITIKLPTPTPEPEPEPTPEPEPEPTPEPEPEPEPESLAPPTSGGWKGDATYFDPGQGSCGIINGPNDMIAAISYLVMDPMNPGNPNNNPLCGKKIRCTRDGKNPTIITVVDRCPVCAAGDLDLSPAAYAALGGTIAEGRFTIQCNWV